MSEQSIGIIGGADGPTAVLVSGEALPLVIAAGVIILAAALIVTAIVVTHNRK